MQARIQRPTEETPDLLDWWFGCLFTFGDALEDWATSVFVAWGEQWLPELIAEAMDGEVEYMLDNAFAEIVDLFPRTATLRRLAVLRQRYQLLRDKLDAPGLPHRPVRMGTANHIERRATIHRVPSAFHDQPTWHAQFRKIAWFDQPPEQGVPLLSSPGAKPCLLVVHLFSGRRREQDFHWFLQKMADDTGVTFLILSMDTAVSPFWGDLHRTSSSWAFLEQCYQRGLVAGTLVGSPCETFSEARFTPPPHEDARRWPRPLRSAERLYGLDGLTVRELLQVQTGTNFFLQGLEALCGHLCHGGVFLSEHPGEPRDLERPTTWRAALTMLLRSHTDVRFGHIQQYEFGAPAVKPTGLLSCRLPGLFRTLRRHVLPHATRPAEAAIGVGGDGVFRTSKLKEYPPRMCEAFARVFSDHFRTEILARRCRTVPEWSDATQLRDLKEWVAEATAASACIRAEAVWLPDYQPRAP